MKKSICDNCNAKTNTHVIPIQLPKEEVSYIELCTKCLRSSFKIIFEELLTSEETLAEQVGYNCSRKAIFHNVLKQIKRV